MADQFNDFIDNSFEGASTSSIHFALHSRTGVNSLWANFFHTLNSNDARRRRREAQAFAHAVGRRDIGVADVESEADKRVADAEKRADKLVEAAEKRADKLVAAAEKRADKLAAEAEKRVIDVKLEAEARADKLVADADKRADKAHDRLVNFSKFALDLASNLKRDSTPWLSNEASEIKESQYITYGC